MLVYVTPGPYGFRIFSNRRLSNLNFRLNNISINNKVYLSEFPIKNYNLFLKTQIKMMKFALLVATAAAADVACTSPCPEATPVCYM